MECWIAAMTECSELWEAVYGSRRPSGLSFPPFCSCLHPSQSLSAAVGSFVECGA